jgi:protoporphyrinogen oxidase
MPRVAIVGAGAAGVFTAYSLREMYGNGYDIQLFEANDRVGGNTYTRDVEYGGKSYSIDCGAQFFS